MTVLEIFGSEDHIFVFLLFK